MIYCPNSTIIEGRPIAKIRNPQLILRNLLIEKSTRIPIAGRIVIVKLGFAKVAQTKAIAIRIACFQFHFASKLSTIPRKKS